MIQTCEEEMHECACSEALKFLAMDDYRRGRDRPKKYWGEVIRQDMTQLSLTRT